MMISADAARKTVDLGDGSPIEPPSVEYTPDPRKGPPIPDAFSSPSDTNSDWLDRAGLLAMLAEGKSRERRRRAAD